jgi:GNAT superfamily N-acetyltransferase
MEIQQVNDSYITSFRYIINEKRVGYIDICNNTILSIESVEQGKGYGSFLLHYAISFLKREGYTCIYLDDMSDRYRKSHNIYIKHGFEYLYEDGPEMIYYF